MPEHTSSFAAQQELATAKAALAAARKRRASKEEIANLQLTVNNKQAVLSAINAAFKASQKKK